MGYLNLIPIVLCGDSIPLGLFHMIANGCAILMKLKGTFFDTAVGSRPNLARMCG